MLKFTKKVVYIFVLLQSILALSGCAVHRDHSPEAGNSYDSELSKVMIDFSILAYEENKETLKSKLASTYPKYKLLRRIDEKENEYDTQGFVAYSDEKIIIAIRGSSSIQDWLNNLKVGKYTNSNTSKYCEHAEMHGGFHKVSDHYRSSSIST
jgi:predicted lipase